MTLLIDPPVSPYSTPAEIEAWLEELRAMRLKTELRDPSDLESIALAEAEAERWLRPADEEL